MPNRPNPPCKNCPVREVGCHSTCQMWMSYQKKKEEWNAMVMPECSKYRMITNAEIERKAAENRRKRKK